MIMVINPPIKVTAAIEGRPGAAPAYVSVVVDGVRISSSSSYVLDPHKIKKIEVFKGPDALAKYGEDAAHGAIVITTK